MKIIMFQYNRDASAICSTNALTSANDSTHHRLTANRFIAGGYADRLLWEEAASLRPQDRQEYLITGHWQ